MDMIYLIDRLESLAANAKRMPITGKAMIDSERLIEVVDQMRLSVPQSVQEATEVLEQRDSIINQSATDARRLRATAERESRMLVEESELVASAKRRADSIIQEAEEQASQLIAKAEANAVARRNGADEYAHEILLQLEQKLASTLETVRHGIGAVSAGEQPRSASAA
jgi:regulator of protease activity HflC (stomatin/prohibitin superfamily)